MSESEFHLLQPRLLRFTRVNFPSLSSQDCEDVCQQAWETLFRRCEVEAKPVPNAFPFLCQACRWGALSILRAGRRCRPVPEIPEETAPVETRPEEAVDRLLSERHLDRFLEAMPAEERELAHLVIEDSDRPTVEEKLGITGEQLVELWDDTFTMIIERALGERGNPVRRALLEANGADRLDPRTRMRLDRAAANDPTLCLDLASSL